MKKQLITLCLTAFTFSACQQEDLPLAKSIETQEQNTFSGIQVENGYLNFASNDIFQEYLTSLEEDRSSESASTRSGMRKIQGFTSIASLKESLSTTTRNASDIQEEEEMSQDEFNLMNAEELLVDPILMEVMDTTLRIKIDDRFFKVTPYGTFSASGDNIDFIEDAIAKFDTTLIHSNESGKYIELGNGVTFTNTFGDGSVIESELTPVEEEPATRAVTSNFHDGYNVNSYKWKNNSLYQKFWDKIRGKDVSKENYFDSKKRVQVNVFDINYAFYASAGIKVKMQRRKKFLFVKYWVSENADKLAIGFNKVHGVLKLKNPRSFSSITPTTSTNWNNFTGTINGIISKFVYGNYRKLDIVKDWVDDIYMFLPEVTIANNVYPNKDIMNKLYNTPADYIYKFLKQQAGKHVYTPIKKQIQPKDPRISYLVWGNTSYTFNQEKPYIMGVKEYGRRSSKTVRFDRSFGFTLNNFSVTGFLPTEFDIHDIDAFGAAYYNGRWKGIRLIK